MDLNPARPLGADDHPQQGGDHHPDPDVGLVAVRLRRARSSSSARRASSRWRSPRSPTEHLKNDRPQAAIDAAQKYPQSHLARVVSAGLQSFQFESQTSPLSDVEVVEAAGRAVERSTLLTTSDFKKGIGSLATIATITPFIGLFGTVIGIINAFHGMALTGSGGIGAVSAGIAEALVATAIGLGVAIPAAWMFNYFTDQLERLSGRDVQLRPRSWSTSS